MLMATVTEINRKRGDTYPITVNVLKDDGTAFDLTGATNLLLGISSNKANDSPGTADVILTGSLSDAPNGVADFAVDANAAGLAIGSYFAEVQFTQGGYIRTTSTFKYKVLGQIIT